MRAWAGNCYIYLLPPGHNLYTLADITLAASLSVTAFAVIGTLLAFLGSLVQGIVLLALVTLRSSVISARFAVWLALGTLPIVGPAKKRLADIALQSFCTFLAVVGA